MNYYLLDNPPASSQGIYPRSATRSGVVCVHTDEFPPQPGGSLGTAEFIEGRLEAGCYHSIVDSTTTTRMYPIDWSTWGSLEPPGMNGHAMHVAARHQAHLWGRDPGYDDATIDRMGAEIARVMTAHHGSAAAARQFVRWITRSQAAARVPGIIEHGIAQPSNRSDPWTKHPNRTALRAQLLDAVSRHLGGTTQPTLQEEFVMDAEARRAFAKLNREVAHTKLLAAVAVQAAFPDGVNDDRGSMLKRILTEANGARIQAWLAARGIWPDGVNKPNVSILERILDRLRG